MWTRQSIARGFCSPPPVRRLVPASVFYQRCAFLLLIGIWSSFCICCTTGMVVQSSKRECGAGRVRAPVVDNGVAKTLEGASTGSLPSTRESDGFMGPVILSSTELARMRQQVRPSSDVDGIARGRLPRRLAANFTTRCHPSLIPPPPCLTAGLPHPNPRSSRRRSSSRRGTMIKCISSL